MFLTAEDFRRERLWLRLTAAEAARRAGITPSRLSKVETGRIGMSQAMRRRLVAVIAGRLAELSARGPLPGKGAA